MPPRPDAATLRAAAYENPRPEVVAMVPGGRRRVLDLGCSSGALGAALKARDGCAVVGVEVDPEYAAAARERLDEVVCADLEQLDLAALGGFDCVVAADVLEHLRDPWAVLAAAAALLSPGDPVVVSLPNVRFWETFWALGRHGSFPRAARGLFDATHLRWFTLHDAIGLLDASGVDFVGVDRRMRLGRHYHPRRDRLAERLKATPLRSFLTYQHVLLGRRRGPRGAPRR